ncbi:MAG TPA: PQQ-binding-like beta-propeller repeat protein, partial [Phycisphaerae bacterium]|nr:PQQ-binding-like beta-propeller repeat protein [Phycisphaerae bacterium]
LFAYQFGAAIISPEKKVVWNFDAPAPTEIHTADAVGTDKVAVVENGLPPKLVVLNIADGKEVSSFTLPAQRAAAPGDIHAQFRRMRVLPNGNFLVCHMDMGAQGKVVEYDKDGKAGWSVTIQSPWSAERLSNGNTLIASNSNFVREVDPKGETVWEFRPADAPGYRIFNTQTAQRLPNGNTVISNWHGKDAGGEPAQFIEVTPDKKVVWALRSWTDPNLGVSTNFQLLDK